MEDIAGINFKGDAMLLQRFLVISAVFFLLLAPMACSRESKVTQQPEDQKVAMAPPPPVQEPAQSQPSEQFPSESPAPEVDSYEPPARTSEPAAAPTSTTRKRSSKPAAQAPVAAEPAQSEPMAEPASNEPSVVPSPSRRVDEPTESRAKWESEPQAPAVPPAPPKPTTAVVAEGTIVDVRLTQALTSAKALVGDKFSGVLERDLEVNGQLLAPKGSRVSGKVTDVAASGKVKGLARMAVTLTAIEVGDERYTVETNTVSQNAEQTKSRDAKVIAGGAGVGAVIGAIAGGKKGAAIGAAVGGGAGTAGVLATKGKEVEYPAEHRLSFRLEKDVEMKRP